MEPTYTLVPLTQEEGDALTKDLTAVLEKYNAEIGIKSTLEILKRVQESPYGTTEDKIEETSDTQAEEGSGGSSEEPAV